MNTVSLDFRLCIFRSIDMNGNDIPMINWEEAAYTVRIKINDYILWRKKKTKP